ncbi:MAG: phosphoribosylanthranilate isomerase [Chloroherpetonaceae bacterium]|nr:phosphoribosylanthranilate isomerase [Chthonomonadaceae bacterium]MDW8209169.1 phosphoribosylanthranilate isomerase [Chloroherpetonaceae bacterium]
MRTRIKVCGITREEDARVAIEAGADALGFVLVPESPRYYALERGSPARWCLPPFVTCVAVCRRVEDLPEPFARDFPVLQFYDLPSNGHLCADGHTLVYAVRMQNQERLEASMEVLDRLAAVRGRCPIRALVLDTYHPERLGGSGQAFDWDLAVEVRRRCGLPVILAGGLNPENVGEAVRRVRPYGVDVSSGVEVLPGQKDPGKIRAFIQAVRQADHI